MTPVIEISKLTKTYQVGDVSVEALRGISFSADKGEFLAIMGASGSGKSTLMNLIGCLDQPTSGDYYLEGNNVNNLTTNEYATIRNQKIGFVFQGFNLLPRTTALENVELPLFYDRTNHVKDTSKRAIEALDRVGLADRMDHDPNQLSGGEQQRVAVARALVNNPSIILADEPTGNLDSKTSIDVLSVFRELNDQGITIFLVTHEAHLAKYARRIIEMRDGFLISDKEVKHRETTKGMVQR